MYCISAGHARLITGKLVHFLTTMSLALLNSLGSIDAQTLADATCVHIVTRAAGTPQLNQGEWITAECIIEPGPKHKRYVTLECNLLNGEQWPWHRTDPQFESLACAGHLFQQNGGMRAFTKIASLRDNTLFATLFLALQRLEDTTDLPRAHHSMMEEMLECWTLADHVALTRQWT